jgi:hypothetical protein
MKLNLNATFTTLNGQIIGSPSDPSKPLQLREVISLSLSLARCPMPPAKAWNLAKAVSTADEAEMDIPIEEVAQVKAAIEAHGWTPMVIAQAFESLEGK